MWCAETVFICWHTENLYSTQRTCIASIKKTWVFGVHLLACKTEFIFWYAEKVFICLLFVGMKKRPVWFINLLVCRKGVYQEMALTSSQLTARSGEHIKLYIMMYLC